MNDETRRRELSPYETAEYWQQHYEELAEDVAMERRAGITYDR